MNNLWRHNSPSRFWSCEASISGERWEVATRSAIPTLGLADQNDQLEVLLQLTLGEGRFGPNHWRLGRAKRLYYGLKPALPRRLIDVVKTISARSSRNSFPLGWPIEERYVQFQWEAMRQFLTLNGQSAISFRRLWPHGKRFAFVLTHDIETEAGQEFALTIADIEEDLGFRSSFNFVPERYRLDRGLMNELRQRGFEIGVHGLNHDGKLFNSHQIFMERARQINEHLKDFGAVGFRAPLTHRNPNWLQALEVEYDLSFFDTDPFEPMPGGCMSIWPFFLGRFVELPYTLVQDSTLYHVLGQTTPAIWLEKVDFIEQYHGMALLNTHPDYLKQQELLQIYVSFLRAMKQRGRYWHALPREVARWWQWRANKESAGGISPGDSGTVILEGSEIKLA